jgi:hypothetical protein
MTFASSCRIDAVSGWRTQSSLPTEICFNCGFRVLSATALPLSPLSANRIRKKNMKFFAALLFAMAVLSGCGSTNTSLKDADRVPAERIFSTAYTTPGDDKQKLTVIRNGGTMIGSGMHMYLNVDGERIAELGINDTVDIYLLRGEHLLMVEPKYLSSSSSQLSAAVSIPTKFPVYRFDVNLNGPRFQPSIE